MTGRLTAGLGLAALLMSLLTATPASSAAAAAPGTAGETTGAPAPETTPSTYANPVTAGVVDTFPDPTMIRGMDGLWYAYGTQNPVFQSKGEDGERMLPILRSSDMTHWQYAGEVFTPATQPAWQDHSRLWAPDIRYVNGRYHLYFAVPGRNTVGLVTAPTPTGPWTDEGAVLPAPSGCPSGNIDEAQFTDTDGASYMYWGSYDTICVAKMNTTLTRVEGPVTQVARGRRVEGGYVVKRDGYYYLFYSDAGCCSGAYSGYQVKVGRATSPTGPFTDPEGVDLMSLTSKGGIVVGANGDRWIGPGHNGIQTDLSGQDWLVYHGIPSDDPDLKPAAQGTLKLTRRPMLIDRLDWIDGWPVVRAGAGPSEGDQPAPVTTWNAGGTFNDGSLADWRAEGAGPAGWRLADDPDAHGYVTYGGDADDTNPGAHGQAAHDGDAYLVSAGRAPARLRAEADLRVTSGTGSAGLTIGYVNRENHVVAWLDASRSALVTDVVIGGRSRGESVTPLPADFRFDTWHNVTVEVHGTRMTVQVSGDRLRDALAQQDRDLPRAAIRPGAVGVAAHGDGAAADNVGATALYTPVTRRVPDPEPGTLLPDYSDEFDGTAVPGTTGDSPWQWVRGPAAGITMAGGALSWPTQDGDLYLGDNRASVLLRDAPTGDYTVETKLRFAPGQPSQQAGIVLYENDDRWFKMVHSALPLQNGGGAVLQVSEFGKEGEQPTTTPPTAVANAPMFGGPTADTMWLRLSYHADVAHGENEVRAATSRDGEHWVYNGVWTLPTKGRLRIGLVSMNRSGALARFDYLRTYRD